MQLSLVETTLWLDLGKLRMRDIYALSDEEVLRFFVRQRLLKNKMNCDKCGRSMRINKREKLIDGKWWSCKYEGKQCSNKSIRSGSWLSSSHLKMSQILLLCYMWAQDFSIKQTVHESHITEQTVIDWFNLCREICKNHCHNQLAIGGKYSVIEIDETCICRRKYNRGRRRIGNQQWIFGGIERGEGGKAFALQVPDRKKKTLLKLIRRHIKPGSTIISDEWPAYRKLGKRLGRYIGYKHYTICHKKTFTRTENDLRIHTNKVEGFWMHAKHKIKRLMGTSRMNVDSYVAEAVFRQNCRADNKIVLEAMLERVAIIFHCE